MDIKEKLNPDMIKMVNSVVEGAHREFDDYDLELKLDEYSYPDNYNYYLIIYIGVDEENYIERFELLSNECFIPLIDKYEVYNLSLIMDFK